MQNKKAQIEFNWLFALIVGAVILFLAFLFASRLISTERYASETELVKNFDILLNPFASVGGIGRITLAKAIEMPQAVQINQTCSASAADSKITMRMRSESSVGSKWGEWSAANNIYNKYIFSDSFMAAKRFDVLGKPFEVAFRVDDLIYVIDKNYCFVNAPSNVKSELEWLNLSRIQFAASSGSCKPDSLKVCFGTACDITVIGQCSPGCESAYDYGYVQKSGRVMNYVTSSLMYGAIFSDSAMYNCEFSRLTARLKSIAEIYQQKASMLSSQGCNTDLLQERLGDVKDAVLSAEIIYKIAQDLEDANPAECPVF